MSKYFEFFTELIGFLQIVASPLFIGIAVGSLIYFPNQTLTRLIIAIGIVLIFLIIGIVFATRKFKSEKGTIWFISRVMATPELDKLDQENQKKEK